MLLYVKSVVFFVSGGCGEGVAGVVVSHQRGLLSEIFAAAHTKVTKHPNYQIITRPMPSSR